MHINYFLAVLSDEGLMLKNSALHNPYGKKQTMSVLIDQTPFLLL